MARRSFGRYAPLRGRAPHYLCARYAVALALGYYGRAVVVLAPRRGPRPFAAPLRPASRPKFVFLGVGAASRPPRPPCHRRAPMPSRSVWPAALSRGSLARSSATRGLGRGGLALATLQNPAARESGRGAGRPALFVLASRAVAGARVSRGSAPSARPRGSLPCAPCSLRCRSPCCLASSRPPREPDAKARLCIRRPLAPAKSAGALALPLVGRNSPALPRSALPLVSPSLTLAPPKLKNYSCRLQCCGEAGRAVGGPLRGQNAPRLRPPRSVSPRRMQRNQQPPTHKNT